MSPLTSPDDNSPAKPAPSIETKETCDDLYSNIDDIEGLNSNSVTLSCDINKDHVINPLYKWEFMEIDWTHVHNIEIPLIFTYGAELESIYNVKEYNRKGPAVTTNTLYCFKTAWGMCSCWLSQQRIDFSIDVSLKQKYLW